MSEKRMAEIKAAPSWTTNKRDHCHCCGQPAHRFTPLKMTDKGWTCSSDPFCLAGTQPISERET